MPHPALPGRIGSAHTAEAARDQVSDAPRAMCLCIRLAIIGIRLCRRPEEVNMLMKDFLAK